jgi:hypothetical protein
MDAKSMDLMGPFINKPNATKNFFTFFAGSASGVDSTFSKTTGACF